MLGGYPDPRRTLLLGFCWALPIDIDYTYNLDNRFANFYNGKQFRHERFDKVSQTAFKIIY